MRVLLPQIHIIFTLVTAVLAIVLARLVVTILGNKNIGGMDMRATVTQKACGLMIRNLLIKLQVIGIILLVKVVAMGMEVLKVLAIIMRTLRLRTTAAIATRQIIVSQE